MPNLISQESTEPREDPLVVILSGDDDDSCILPPKPDVDDCCIPTPKPTMSVRSEGTDNSICRTTN